MECQFVHLQAITDNTDSTVHRPRAVPDLTNFMPYPCASFDMHFGSGFQHLKNPLRFYYSVERYAHSDVVNAAVQGLVDENAGKSPPKWYGPLVVVKLRHIDGTDFMDITEEDVNHVRAFFTLMAPT